MQFTERLRHLMDGRDLSTYRMSKELGVADNLIGYWLRGMRQPAMDNLVRLADYFGVTIDYLVGKSDLPDYSASEDMNTFPLLPIRMKALREEKGLDIYQMAALLSETPRNYAGYEAGEVLPRMRVVCALADYFDVSLDYLVGRSDDPRQR